MHHKGNIILGCTDDKNRQIFFNKTNLERCENNQVFHSECLTSSNPTQNTGIFVTNGSCSSGL